MKIFKKLATMVLGALIVLGGVALFTGCGEQPPITPEGNAITSVEQLQDAFAEGGTYYLAKNLSYTSITLLVDNKDVTLDFNGHKLNIKFDGSIAAQFDAAISKTVPSYVFKVVNGGKLTLNATNGGGLDCNWTDEFYDPALENRNVAPYIFYIGAGSDVNAEEDVAKANTVTINGGKYVTTDSCSILNLVWGTANVTGGSFEMKFSDTEVGNDMVEANVTTSLLNRVDSSNGAYKQKSVTSEIYERNVKIVVTGGTFKDFDPKNMLHDPKKPTSYVPEGYDSTPSANGWYTVKEL